jgi:hypothetical protein
MRRQVDPHQSQTRPEGDKHKDPYPTGNERHQTIHGRSADDREQSRANDVVEEHEPAGEEARDFVDAEARVGANGAIGSMKTMP